MNNPHSSNPNHALYPHPPRVAGWRLWQMLEARRPVGRAAYLRAFDRRNLVMGRLWSVELARVSAAEMRPGLAGRTVLLLGVEVRRAFGIPPLLLHPQEVGGVIWRQLPHPSGLCRWYNDPDNRGVAGMLLEELYDSACSGDPGLPRSGGPDDGAPGTRALGDELGAVGGGV